jgi:hypothetical protein
MAGYFLIPTPYGWVTYLIQTRMQNELYLKMAGRG